MAQLPWRFEAPEQLTRAPGELRQRQLGQHPPVTVHLRPTDPYLTADLGLTTEPGLTPARSLTTYPGLTTRSGPVSSPQPGATRARPLTPAHLAWPLRIAS
ncbi:hypothetical protein GCM10018785_52780 [Streptomyces longispororuber]|uniref:Uncharacterized protein n=1 Tax=Streptomyces longispororuber TaxID=68230 RepID=A0A918ZYP1_9ACTN|nr:hypothetical protein GCM10018785_52780 [Streptomyces longispororuber]